MSEQRVVVMGLGNLLWADEGFGVRVAERLYAHYHALPVCITAARSGTTADARRSRFERNHLEVAVVRTAPAPVYVVKAGLVVSVADESVRASYAYSAV